MKQECLCISPLIAVASNSKAFLNHSVVIFNITLLCLCTVALAYYISEANATASGTYDITSLRSQITSLTEQQSLLTSKKSTTENPISALIFAQSQQMMEAKDIVYVFENGNVALQR